jgi:hypothetical protein
VTLRLARLIVPTVGVKASARATLTFLLAFSSFTAALVGLIVSIDVPASVVLRLAVPYTTVLNLVSLRRCRPLRVNRYVFCVNVAVPFKAPGPGTNTARVIVPPLDVVHDVTVMASNGGATIVNGALVCVVEPA